LVEVLKKVLLFLEKALKNKKKWNYIEVNESIIGKKNCGNCFKDRKSFLSSGSLCKNDRK
jgi:hypothetical protein